MINENDNNVADCSNEVGYYDLKRGAERKSFDVMMSDGRLLIDSIIASRGPLPEYINQEDLVDFAYEQIVCMIIENRPNIPSLGDLKVRLERLLSRTFYNIKIRGGCSKRKSVQKESKLQLDSKQKAMFEQYETYVNTVIYKTINVKKLPSGVEIDDLKQIGLIALVRAIQSYDKKYDFLPYANRIIKNAILDAISMYADKASDVAVSFNGVYDDGSSENEVSDMIEGKIVKDKPELSIDTDYETKVLIESMMNIYNKLDEGCVKIGVDAIIKCKLLNYSLTDYAKQIGKTPNNVGAYITKAKKYLKTNPDFLKLVGKSSV